MVGAVNCVSEPALRKQFRVTQTPTALALRVSKRGTLNVLDATVIREEDGYVELIKWAGQVMRQSRYFRAQGDRIDQVLVAARALAQHDPLPALSKILDALLYELIALRPMPLFLYLFIKMVFV